MVFPHSKSITTRTFSDSFFIPYYFPGDNVGSFHFFHCQAKISRQVQSDGLAFFNYWRSHFSVTQHTCWNKSCLQMIWTAMKYVKRLVFALLPFVRAAGLGNIRAEVKLILTRWSNWWCIRIDRVDFLWVIYFGGWKVIYWIRLLTCSSKNQWYTGILLWIRKVIS